ncbi:hypothetical protein EC844_10393 [Acinetobacter calcoaceticus]|uniref:Uncharacterized protein n=1 Tax=Acinetobacter calcoaceticus TaxID=471 RepID=A0A4V2R1N0_ACICA|nr:hypothetical protein EC844_10393 [Acinetobacter calcoaceticus]
MKKILRCISLWLFNTAAIAETFTLIEKEHEKGDRYNPSTTSYSYIANKPLNIQYFYGYDSDWGKAILAIQFSELDTQGTFLGTTQYPIEDEQQAFLKSLSIPNKNPKTGCTYHGEAVIKLDYVYVVRNDLTTSSNGGAFIYSIKPIGAAVLKCDQSSNATTLETSI